MNVKGEFNVVRIKGYRVGCNATKLFFHYGKRKEKAATERVFPLLDNYDKAEK